MWNDVKLLKYRGLRQLSAGIGGRAGDLSRSLLAGWCAFRLGRAEASSEQANPSLRGSAAAKARGVLSVSAWTKSGNPWATPSANLQGEAESKAGIMFHTELISSQRFGLHFV